MAFKVALKFAEITWESNPEPVPQEIGLLILVNKGFPTSSSFWQNPDRCGIHILCWQTQPVYALWKKDDLSQG
ncbi:hypothetical protein F2P79_003299 [Pimephales promelas]|nr:hypothetical protein F2P79_003299 [Pimephales promelas]